MRRHRWFGLFLGMVFLLPSPAMAYDGRENPGKKGEGPGEVRLVFRDFEEISPYSPPSNFVLMDAGKGVWDFGRAGGEVTFLSKGGRIYIDRNGNGKADKGDGSPLEDYDTLEGSLVFRGRKVSYQVRVRIPGGSRRYFRLESRSVLFGRWGPYEMTFLDKDMDGRFFEFGIDRVLVRKGSKRGNEAGFLWSSGGFQPLSRVLRLGEGLFLVDAEEGEGRLKLHPYPGRTSILEVKAGGKRKPETALTLAAPSRDLYFRLAGQGRFVLPAFDYRIQDLRADFFEPLPKGSFSEGPIPIPSLVGKTWASQVKVDLRKGKVLLDPGPPYTLDFRAMIWGKGGNRLEISDVSLVSPTGLRFRASLYERKGNSSIKAFLRAGKDARFLAKLEYG